MKVMKLITHNFFHGLIWRGTSAVTGKESSGSGAEFHRAVNDYLDIFIAIAFFLIHVEAAEYSVRFTVIQLMKAVKDIQDSMMCTSAEQIPASVFLNHKTLFMIEGIRDE